VKALLLEIKRLRGVLAQVHQATAALPRYDGNLNAAAGVLRVLELLEDEPAIDSERPDRSRQTAAGAAGRERGRTGRQARGAGKA